MHPVEMRGDCSPRAVAKSEFETVCQSIRDDAIEHKSVFFFDSTTFPATDLLSNPSKLSCELDFAGRHYFNSETLFQSLKYTDNATAYQLFNRDLEGDPAIDLSRQHRMTPAKFFAWECGLAESPPIGEVALEQKEAVMRVLACEESLSHLPIQDFVEWAGASFISTGLFPHLKNEHLHYNKLGLMLAVTFIKYSKNKEAAQVLQATGEAYICERRPEKEENDFWGDGGDGSGKNVMGLCLMLARSYLFGNRSSYFKAPEWWEGKSGPPLFYKCQ